MKLISWNVNGLRACMGKGFLDFFNQIDADMFCIQETKMQPGQLELELDGYHQYWCSAQKRGIPVRLCFAKKSRCPWHMNCRSQFMPVKAGLLQQNLNAFTW